MSSLAVAIPGLLFLTLCYAALSAVSPFGNCRKCRGFGFKVTTTRRGRLKAGPTCRRCHGDRIRIRFGRHLWNLWARTRRNGTR